MITNPPVDQPVLDKTNNGLFSMPWRLWLSQFNIVATSLTTVSDVTGTAPITSTGGTTPAIGIPKANAGVDGYLSSTDWTTFNNKVTSVSGAAPLVSSGGTTPNLSIPVATTSANGYLSSTDWNTFNNKASVGTAPITKTANFSVGLTDSWLINNKSGSTCIVTMPAAATYSGRQITFKNMQAQLLVSASSNIVPLDSTTAGTAILLDIIGNWATVVSDGSNWVIMQAASNNNLLLE